MKITSKNDLKRFSDVQGYRAEILEKVILLLELSSYCMSSKILRENLVLKGGTAINLFCTKKLPRLSVDLDFNYSGSEKKEKMLNDKPIITQEIVGSAARLNMTLHRNPGSHAGGKMVFIYNSLLGSKGRLEIDVNYMYRIPLWDISHNHPLDWLGDVNMPILDIHELAAGKLSALFDRAVSRDLYDAHQLLTNWDLDEKKLRLAFVVYLAMSKNEWQGIDINNVKYDVKDIKNRLIPVLHKSIIVSHSYRDIEAFASTLELECKKELAKLLPFRDNEQEFLSLLQEEGIIKPDLITNDSALCDKIIQHPLIRWRALQCLNRS
jgi:predicted nucleotidyltransferase component of viral defense system